MKLKYLSHSTFEVTGRNFKALIDPFISENPNSPVKVSDYLDITHIFITHGHGDHFGDAIEIAKECNSTVICNFELAHYIISKDQTINVHPMHIGGRTNFDFGRVKMTSALHGSGILHNDIFICGGNPCGFIIEADGKKIYHAGDTGLTLDMKLLESEKIDIALLPIGGNFTMDIEDAIRAVDFIKPKTVIPMHYKTFEVIDADPEEFREKTEKINVKVMDYGEVIEV
ncbi:metal-dependent hydrolase [Sporosalibacterium faouarense]|uniref:metal-dependent hydrolase n=1 Tax=Sporosalibacterium faouarense TaxID=516123 RepID=UPI00141CF1A3|nr:metal-dependent hydrolase [Sporosalibacterium faouarense]MTI47035.1 metal-dependent hydrolase [Bacillota bacterium]